MCPVRFNKREHTFSLDNEPWYKLLLRHGDMDTHGKMTEC